LRSAREADEMIDVSTCPGFFSPQESVMTPRTAFAASGLILSLMLLSPAAFAQPIGGPPQSPEEAPAAPGAPNASSAENQAQKLALQIEKARKQGKDVSKAEAEEKQGEAALHAGYRSEATQHFKRAQQELGSK
jgi:hypothetical protein